MADGHKGQFPVPIFSLNNLGRFHRLQLLSLLPVSIAALLNVGYLYLTGSSNISDLEANDLRGRFIRALGANQQDPGIFDLLLAGFAYMAPILAIALLTGAVWERIIAEKRQRPFESGFAIIALLFTLLLPAATSLAHVVLGMSFAIIVGKGIFGGEGKTFLSPALLGIAFVQVSFPGAAGEHILWNGLAGYSGSNAISLYHHGGEAALIAADINLSSAFFGFTPGPMGTTSIFAIMLGAAFLLYCRLIAWRLLLAQLIGLVISALVFNALGAQTGVSSLSASWHLLLGSFAFGAVYLACDPVASSCTNPGRWIQGLLIGFLVVLIRVVNPTHPDAVIPILLLVSILAPLIDHAVVAVNIHNRSRRHV